MHHGTPHATRQPVRIRLPRVAAADAGPSEPADSEDGSLVTEYGLIAIVGATIASLVIKWASGGAIWQLFDAVTSKVRVLLGA